MKRLLWNALPAMLALVWLASGCLNDKKEVVDSNVNTVQITHFKMESKNLPELAQTFFSIDHRNGRIYNAIPLPYRSSFDTVKLTIAVFKTNTTTIFVDGAVRKPISTDSIDLSGWEKGIEVQITNRDSTMSKRYKVEINRYEYDPETYIWQQNDHIGFPHMTNVERVDFYPSSTYGAEEQSGRYLLYRNGATEVYSVVYPHRNSPFVEEKAEKVNHAIDMVYIPDADRDFRYTLLRENGTKDNSPITLNLSSWSTFGELASQIETKDLRFQTLLGGFIKPGDLYPTAALIIQDADNGHKSYFAAASVVDNKLVIRKGEAVPDSFPTHGFGHLNRTQANYPLLMLAGGYSQDGNLCDGVWSTTTALDWLCLKKSAEHSLPKLTAQPLFLYDREADCYFYFVNQIALTSSDAITWLPMNRDLAMPEGDLRSTGRSAMVGMITPGHRVWLIGGQTPQKEWKEEVWVGYPKIYAQP